MNNHFSTLQNNPPLESTNSICELSAWGLIKINGADAKKFLQGQLTCNMEEVTFSQQRRGAHCNPQGRVLSLFYAFLLQNSYYLLMPRCLIPIAMAALKKYGIFYKTELSDASDEFVVMGYIGEEAHKEGQYVAIQTGKQRYILIGSKESMQQRWKLASTISPDHWKQLDLSDGIPSIYPETSGKFLPHEINLDKLDAIHFNKGCYTGQEIIARIHYRAKLKNHLYHAMVSSISCPLLGADIYSQQDEEIKVAGVIVDVCHKINHQYAVLIITDESNAKDHHLFLNKNEKEFFTHINEA